MSTERLVEPNNKMFFTNTRDVRIQEERLAIHKLARASCREQAKFDKPTLVSKFMDKACFIGIIFEVLIQKMRQR